MRPGELVSDRYRLERVAGAGAMGTVFRAVDVETDRVVALKVLHAHADLARFEREIVVLSRLEHPAIVRCFGHGTEGGSRWLAMEWIEGEPLSERLRRGPMDIDAALSLARGIAGALGAAHRRGIVHRDVKPSNVFLRGGSASDPVLLDFGIARSLGGTGGLTLTGDMVGTPGYMAPEQARGEKNVDPRADVFALGCVLYKALAGHSAFDADETMALLLKVVLEEPARLMSVRPEVGVALDRLVGSMLSKTPAGRPADGDAVLAALDRTVDDAMPSLSKGLGSRERRVVCLVVAKPDPERHGRRDSRAWAEAVERHDGRLVELADGSLLVTVDGTLGGASSRSARAIAATDVSARAARAALSLAPLLGGAPVAIVAGHAVELAAIPVGEVVERGTAMLGAEAQLACSGAIVVDETAAALLDVSFDVRRKGEGGRQRRLLVGEHDSAGAVRSLLGRATPCVGREDEIAELVAFVEACTREPDARAALVTGAPGIGKSRVRQELTRALRVRGWAGELLIARGDPSRTGSPGALVGELVRRAARVPRGQPPEAQRAKLLRRIEEDLPAAEAGAVASVLAPLAGIEQPAFDTRRPSDAGNDHMALAIQTRTAFEAWLAGAASKRPTLVVFEDLHWGDAVSVGLIDAALRGAAGTPLAVLALARPEVHELFPRLWGDRLARQMRLGSLPQAGAGTLVRAVLGDRVGAGTVARIVDRAGGNPFFLEELIRAAAEGRIAEAPASVLAVIEGRLGAVDPRARRVLRAAAVFGRVFWTGGIAALLGDSLRAEEIDAAMVELLDSELVARQRDSRFPGQTELVFRHALVRDAAYASLTDDDRRTGHALAATWLESSGECDAGALGEHHERGGAARPAIAWYRRAAEQALLGGDPPGAFSWAARARACGAADADLGALLALEAQAHIWRGEAVDAISTSREARRLLRPGDRLWHDAAATAVLASARLNDTRGMRAVVEEVLEAPRREPGDMAFTLLAGIQSAFYVGEYDAGRRWLARLEALAGDDPRLRGAQAGARGIVAMFDGDIPRAVAELSTSSSGYDTAISVFPKLMPLVVIGALETEAGDPEAAERTLLEVIEASERLGLEPMAAAGRHNLGRALFGLGRPDEALSAELEAYEVAQGHGNRRLIGGCRNYMAQIRLAVGDLDEALDDASAAAEILAPWPPTHAHALAALADVLRARGDGDRAVVEASHAHAIVERLGSIHEGETYVRVVFAEALAAAEDPRAEDAAVRAKARLLERASCFGETERARFLSRGPGAVRTLALVRVAERS